MADVVVVGAGAIGLCSAYALRKRGLDVVVVDSADPGSGASHGNGGWVCPSDSMPLPAPGVTSSTMRWLLQADSPLYIKLRPEAAFARWLWTFWRSCDERAFAHGIDALARLNARTMELFDAMAADGVEFEMHRQGLLFLYRDEEAAQREAHELARLERHGYAPARWLDGAALRDEEPAVSPEVAAGLLAPDDRHVRPETLVSGLAKRLGEMGTPVRTGEAVTGFTRAGCGVTRVQTVAGEIPAAQVVLAAGVASAPLARLIGTRLPLEAGKGYSVTMAPPRVCLKHPIHCGDTRVGLSPYNGAIRVLGTMELSGVNTTLVPRRIAALKAAPCGYIQGWEIANVQEEWTGMRPLTPDGLPIIGRAPSAENVVIATGHAMLGITLSASTGEAVADLVTGHPDTALLRPFRVGRF